MHFANNFITIVCSIALLAAILGSIFAEPIVRVMAPGYAEVPGKIEETAKLLRILFPSIAFTATAYVVVGILQSFGEFTVPSLISVVSNAIMIAYLLIFRDKLGLPASRYLCSSAGRLSCSFSFPGLRRQGLNIGRCLI